MIRWMPATALDPTELRSVVGEDRFAALQRVAALASDALGGLAIVHVNATATGGGVAEMLPTLLGYARGFGIDAKWAVVAGEPEFFTLTKRLHNRLHGHPGDSGVLDDRQRRVYERVLADAGRALLTVMRRSDIAVLHDPQTLGLAPLLRDLGIRTVWRCHIGTDIGNPFTREGWEFLHPYLPAVDRFVFSRGAFRPELIPAEKTHIIVPTLDPLSPKNRPLPAGDGRAMLTYAGLLQGHSDGAPAYRRRDGSVARIERRADLVQLGPPPPIDRPLVVQVSRWDRLKDMPGVLLGFAEHVVPSTDAHLVLAGPNVSGVADDPEGAAELERCLSLWRDLPHAQRQRVHLACLPMADIDENALVVNALQRHAAVVTQKSLAEGFGLTVLEAMWKGRPVVASEVGGIRDQVRDQQSGLLLHDPQDLPAFGHLVRRLLQDPVLAESMGRAAKERAAEFLPDLSLIHWSNLIVAVATSSPSR